VITGPQCRAARALLGWSVQELSELSGVSARSIHTCERALGVPRMTVATIERIQQALERGGVEFIQRSNGGVGVRMRR
jgi:transcriptional regulator with XRE-family HTH domain